MCRLEKGMLCFTDISNLFHDGANDDIGKIQEHENRFQKVDEAGFFIVEGKRIR